jgi:TonB family protein
MELREKSSVLRRGAAPADVPSSAIFIAVSCLLHAGLLVFFLSKAHLPMDVAMPASTGGPVTRARLIRITPLRTFPPPEAEAPPPEKAAAPRPKPALIRRYTAGAPIVIKQERGQAKKGSSDETKVAARTVAPTPAADLTPRWWSPDSTRSTSVQTDGDFRFAYYLAAIRNKIGREWSPPDGMDARGRHVRATLYFRISRDGQVSLSSVETSSGYAFYDQSAMRALLAATPLPPLPAGYTDQYLGVHFGFEFQQ